MTKAELVAEISRKTGLEKKQVMDTVEALMDVVSTSLASGEPVYLRGFGSFIIKQRAAKPLETLLKIRQSNCLHVRCQHSSPLSH